MINVVRFVGTRRLRWKLLYLVRHGFSATGRSWNDFYAWMLDFQDRRTTLDHVLSRPKNPGKFKGLWDWGRGERYLEFMLRHGLKPTDCVLDLGCGYGRVAIPLLRIQEPGGHYVGTEISKRRLTLAREWVAREGLQAKSHQFIHGKDNSMPEVADSSVDVAWVLSVFNHMPDRELQICLEAIHRTLKPGGRLFCYYLATVDSGDTSVKTFRRSDAEMQTRLDGVGFSTERLEDWDDDLGALRPPDSRMVLAMKRAAQC